MSEDNLPTFDEALRLMIAYYCILEPDKREIVKALVEKYADRARLAEAAAEDPFPNVETKPPPAPRRVDLLTRQREYATHLGSLQFSILEGAIDRLAR